MKRNILIFLLSVILCFCFVSCTTTDTKKETYDIKLTAEYDKNSKNVVTNIENNTGNLAIYQDIEYYLFMKSNSKWVDITPDYADICISYSYVSPTKGKNKLEREYSVYDTAFDNADNDTKNNKKGLKDGKYKISVKVYVCNPTVYVKNKDKNGKEKKIPNFNSNREELYIDTVFNVN